MQTPRYRRLYILGSGFSKSISAEMPTLKDLSGSILREQGDEFADLARFAAGIKAKTEGYPSFFSFERLASLILAKKVYYNQAEQLQYQNLKYQLLKWIFVKIERRLPAIDAEKIGVLGRFLEQCSHRFYPPESERESLIISFNYDLLLERLVEARSNAIMTCDYIVRFNNYMETRYCAEEQEANLIFEYLKLHGSFNWFAAPGSERIELSTVYRVDQSDPSRSLIHEQDIPAFIPMAYSKHEYMAGSLFNVLWNIARGHLASCDEIVFIGYGFPDTDADNLLLFLDHKEKIKEIVVCEAEDSPLLMRLKGLFPECRLINQDAYAYIKESIG